VIDQKGMHIEKPFKDVSGIISGLPQYSLVANEIGRINSLFNEDLSSSEV
jgi:circadian clock protein KaiC